MSISDMIVVMKDGVVQQIGQPQAVYDSPVNLFVAKFLGTPPINVFEGRIQGGRLYAGEDAILSAPGAADQEVWIGLRPEGFIPQADGPLCCHLKGVEVMGRDVSIVSTHPAAQTPTLRAIISAEQAASAGAETVRFAVKPAKTLVFDRRTEERIHCSLN